MPIDFFVRSIKKPLLLPDKSVIIVLDMMASHTLRATERVVLRDEIRRVLKPSGWLFFKSFLLEDDINAARLIKENPADEPNSYIHPTLKLFEHVWTEDEIRKFFGKHFKIHYLSKSRKHILHGHAFKRRTASVYLEKID